jgi:tRNA nucleotidyltransferase (CCA-adding enzyme)
LENLPGELRSKVLSLICPTPEEIKTQQATVSALKHALELRAAKISQPFSFIEAQGSTGKKQTQLKLIADIDLFVGLRLKDYENIISNKPKERNRLIGGLLDGFVDDWFLPAVKTLEVENVLKTYSQHPYLSLSFMGLDVDILCCFDLSAEAIAENGPITAVDRTVHHSNFVADRLTPEKRDDVRLLKSFVRACHAYADDCAVGRMGFTGYSLELLVLESDSFADAIGRLVQLGTKPMDPLNRSVEKLRSSTSFRDDYVLIIDPTDHGRNVASSFDERAVRWVQLRAKQVTEFLEMGSLEEHTGILVEAEIPKSPIPKAIRNHALSFEFQSDRTAHYTVLRDKLHRLARRISSQLESEDTGEARFGKSLTEVYFEDDRFALGVIVESVLISEDYLRKGPPITMKDAAEKFVETHPTSFEESGHLWTRRTRKWTNAKELAESVVEQHSIKGLTLTAKGTAVSRRVLRTLHDYVMQIEKDFSINK